MGAVGSAHRAAVPDERTRGAAARRERPSSPTSPEAEGIGTIIMNLEKYDKVPVFMAATPDFVEKNPDAVVAYLKAWLDA